MSPSVRIAAQLLLLPLLFTVVSLLSCPSGKKQVYYIYTLCVCVCLSVVCLSPISTLSQVTDFYES